MKHQNSSCLALPLIISLVIPIATSGSEINWDSREAMELAKPIQTYVSPKLETAIAHAMPEDDAADDPAIWYNKANPELSVVYGTNKKAGIDVFDLNGNRLQFLEEGLINNIDVRYNVKLGGQSVDIAGATNRTHHAIDIYTIDPTTGLISLLLRQPLSAAIDEAYGFTLAHSFKTASTWALANGKNGTIEQWELTEAGGEPKLTKVRTLQVPSKPEGMVCDDLMGTLYVGEENVGIWYFSIEPESPTEGTLIPSTAIATHSEFEADVEGIALFQINATQGYLIASIQGNNSYAVFERSGDHAYLGSFSIQGLGGVDGVEETDGLDVINLSLGSAFPSGLLVVQDGYNFDQNDQPQAQNFKYIDWSDIAEALNLEESPMNATWIEGIMTQ
jgi:3-phytase